MSQTHNPIHRHLRHLGLATVVMLTVAACSASSDTSSGGSSGTLPTKTLASETASDPGAPAPTSVAPAGPATTEDSVVSDPTGPEAPATTAAPAGTTPAAPEPAPAPLPSPEPDPEPAPAPESNPPPEPDPQPETQADEGLLLAQVDDYTIGVIPPQFGPAIEPGPLSQVTCAAQILYPIGEFEQSQYADMMGDGSADDLVTVHLEGWWKVRIEIAGGPTTERTLGPPRHLVHSNLHSPVHLLEETRQHIVVNYYKAGEDLSELVLFGVDDLGCINDGFEFDYGRSGDTYFSLDCLPGSTYASFTTVYKAETDSMWMMQSASIHPDGSLAPIPFIEVHADNDLVKYRGRNTCL